MANPTTKNQPTINDLRTVIGRALTGDYPCNSGGLYLSQPCHTGEPFNITNTSNRKGIRLNREKLQGAHTNVARMESIANQLGVALPQPSTVGSVENVIAEVEGNRQPVQATVPVRPARAGQYVRE